MITNVNTGDGMIIGLIVGLLIVALVGIVTLLILKKRKNKSDEE